METLMAFSTDEQIRIRAHQLWEQAGKPAGRENEFWHQAEQELKEMERSPASHRQRYCRDR